MRPRRRWWCAALCAACACTLWVLAALVARHNRAPTVLTVTAQQRHRAAFPAVALCPETNFAQARVDAFLLNLTMPPDVSKRSMRDGMRQLAAFTDPDVEFDTSTLVMLEYVLRLNALSILEATLALLPSCEDIILRCRWRGQLIDCRKLFQMNMTGDGFCCSFNGRSLRGKQFPESLVVSARGSNSGLEMVVSHKDESPTSVDLGYKWLVIKDAMMYNEVKSNGTAISRGYENFFGLHTRHLTSSDNVRQLDSSLRRCLEQEESPLKYFPEYHRSYCLVECEMEASIRRCGCAKPTYPVVPNIPECRARALRCATKATAAASCDCPEACEWVTSYSIRNLLSMTAPTHAVDSFYEAVDPEIMSIVRVYLPDLSVLKTRRDCLYTYFDLISQLGGLFNVYMGCSFISVLEVLFLIWRSTRHLLAPSKPVRRKQRLHRRRLPKNF